MLTLASPGAPIPHVVEAKGGAERRSQMGTEVLASVSTSQAEHNLAGKRASSDWKVPVQVTDREKS